MKKSTLLSLLTTATIVTTSIGTYAAWDKLEASTSEDVTFRNPVTLEVSSEYELAEKDAKLGKTPTVTGDVNFTVSNKESKLADTLTIVPEITGGDASTSDFDIVIVDNGESNTPNVDQELSGEFIDKTLDSTSYTVKVTPKSGSESKVQGQSINIKLKATLSNSQNS